MEDKWQVCFVRSEWNQIVSLRHDDYSFVIARCYSGEGKWYIQSGDQVIKKSLLFSLKRQFRQMKCHATPYVIYSSATPYVIYSSNMRKRRRKKREDITTNIIAGELLLLILLLLLAMISIPSYSYILLSVFRKTFTLAHAVKVGTHKRQILWKTELVWKVRWESVLIIACLSFFLSFHTKDSFSTTLSLQSSLVASRHSLLLVTHLKPMCVFLTSFLWTKSNGLFPNHLCLALSFSPYSFLYILSI